MVQTVRSARRSLALHLTVTHAAQFGVYNGLQFTEEVICVNIFRNSMFPQQFRSPPPIRVIDTAFFYSPECMQTKEKTPWNKTYDIACNTWILNKINSHLRVLRWSFMFRKLWIAAACNVALYQHEKSIFQCTALSVSLAAYVTKIRISPAVGNQEWFIHQKTLKTLE